MTTFLWMLYLAFTLFITASLINIAIEDLQEKDSSIMTSFTVVISSVVISALLWSIWYFYYLH